MIDERALLKSVNEYTGAVYDGVEIDNIESVIEYQQTHDDRTAYIVEGFREFYDILEEQPKVGELSEGTNADRIRHMTDDELEKFLSKITNCCGLTNRLCEVCYIERNEYGICSIGDWLQKKSEPYKEGDN